MPFLFRKKVTFGKINEITNNRHKHSGDLPHFYAFDRDVFQEARKKNERKLLLAGKKLPWNLLGLSDASDMFDISGTMWMVALCFVYGFKSIWIPWLWPVFNQVFNMMFLAKWLRRSNADIGAAWLSTRFGISGEGVIASHNITVVFALIGCFGWPHEKLKEKILELLFIFLNQIIDPETHHLILFFDEKWNKRSSIISYGHDIEAAWLIEEAALSINNSSIIGQVKNESVFIANAVSDGLNANFGH